MNLIMNIITERPKYKYRDGHSYFRYRKEGNKSGIGIAKIINVGTSSENAIQNESVSKIKFSIPLVLPTSNTREYYQNM